MRLSFLSALLFVAGALAAPAALAQPSPSASPYPLTYGLGLPNLNGNFGSIRAIGLNHNGMALPDEAYINDFNIALLPYGSQALMIDGDLSFWSNGRTYFDGRPASEGTTRSAPLSKFRIPALRVSYPLISGTLVLRAAYQPVRPYEFQTQTTHLVAPGDRPGGPSTSPLPDIVTRTATGSARLRQYSLGAGFTMLPNITGGVQVDYLTGTFGTASQTRYDFADRPANQDGAFDWTDGGRVTSWRLTAAMSQRLRLTQTLTLRSGLSATYSLGLNAPADPVREGGGGGLPREATRIPVLLRGGLSVSNDRTWRGGIDGSFQRWGAYRTWSGLANYTNAYGLGAAAEYIPGGPEADSYVRRITYRAGLRYDNRPVEELERNISEVSLGLGASFPTSSVLEKRRSYVNAGFRLGRMAYPETNVYRGTTFEVGVGFTFNSRLYIPVGRGNCPIPSCHVRKKHTHDGVEFRGQPWYKMQNPHIGEKLPYRKNTEKPPKNDKARFKF